VRKPEQKMLLGIPRYTWVDITKIHLKEIGCGLYLMAQHKSHRISLPAE
jgi:hypothetical protein